MSLNSLANPRNSRILFHKITCGLPGNKVIIFLVWLVDQDWLVVDFFSFLGGDFDFLVQGLTTTSVEIAAFSGGLPHFLGVLARAALGLFLFFWGLFLNSFFLLSRSICRQSNNRRRIMNARNAL